MIDAIPLSAAGLEMHHAYLVFAADFSGVSLASNALTLTLAPRF